MGLNAEDDVVSATLVVLGPVFEILSLCNLYERALSGLLFQIFLLSSCSLFTSPRHADLSLARVFSRLKLSGLVHRRRAEVAPFLHTPLNFCSPFNQSVVIHPEYVSEPD